MIGFAAGFVCLWGVNGLKKMLGADDSLDVFGGPSFPVDWVTVTATAAKDYDIWKQFLIQASGVGVTVVWSGVVAFIAYKLVDLTIGLRVAEEDEREGLDTAAHGEAAYRL